MKDPSSSKLKAGFKPEERRKQEMHYMQLWKEARAELRSMRQELAGETDEEVIEEIKRDMVGLQKRKNELAKFLGLEVDVPEAPVIHVPPHEAEGVAMATEIPHETEGVAMAMDPKLEMDV